MKWLEYFERMIVYILLVLMMLTIAFATFELSAILFKDLLKPPRLFLNINGMLNVFGFFFLILIGLELLETIKTYFAEQQIHVEIVFLVAMIAVARKVIILELKSLPPVTLIGIAAIILALAVGYFLVKKAHRSIPPNIGREIASKEPEIVNER